VQNVAVHRYFNSNWISQSQVNSWLNEADALGTTAWISFKASAIGTGAGAWRRVYTGQEDAALNIIKNIAVSRRTQGKAPFYFAVEHEPENNKGPISGDCNNSAARAEWAQMQEYLSDFFIDVNDVMAFSTICNGFFWTNSGTSAQAGQYHPQSLINKLRNNKHILAVDQYDAMPGGGIGTKTSGYDWARTTNQRVENKVKEFISWCRLKNTGAIGWGEIGSTVSTANWPSSAQGPAGGATSPGPLTACWNIMRDNRDIVTTVNYFNSAQNSRWDWRLVPSDYPAVSGNPALTEFWPGSSFSPDPNGSAREIGGNAATQARLNEYIAIATASRTAPYNQPPPG